jgi:DNA-binding MarR family transcriptional regulator
LLDIPRQTAIADRMGIEPMTLSGYVDRLEAIGFVVREPDPDDRRAKIVRLTPSGETMVQAVRPVTRRLMEEILAPLGSNGSDRLRDMIEPVRQSLRQRRGAGPAGR